MPRRRVTWFVVADGSRARFHKRREEGDGYEVVATYESPEAHLPTHELMSDRPGRTQESAYPGRHAVEPRHDPHRARKDSFAQEVAAHLNAANAQGEFDALVIYAAPRALAPLRTELDEATRRKVKAEVAKDLTKVPFEELTLHFNETR